VSVLLDRDTVTLDGLDFAPRCQQGLWWAHPAQRALVCRGCRGSLLLCRRHHVRYWVWLLRQLRRSMSIVCTVCGRRSATVQDAMEVVEI